MGNEIWVENACHPGSNWILYSVRYGRLWDLVAWIDRHSYDNGRYRWVAYPYDFGRRAAGFAASLEEAQRMAQLVVMSRDVQLALF